MPEPPDSTLDALYSSESIITLSADAFTAPGTYGYVSMLFTITPRPNSVLQDATGFRDNGLSFERFTTFVGDELFTDELI